MNTNVIARHVGIGMLAFCATFVQTSMFATAHFGAAPSAQSVSVSELSLANGGNMVNKEAGSRRA